MSALGPGCMGMSFSYVPGPKTEQEMIVLIRAAVERGITILSTRPRCTARFTNEELVGEALDPVRERIVITTKFGFDLSAGR